MYRILFECINKIGYWAIDKPKSRWAIVLVASLELNEPEATNPTAYTGYLRDRYKWCVDFMAEGRADAVINIFETKLAYLLKFIGKTVADIDAELVKLDGVDIPVLFTAKPYYAINLFRNPDKGIISFKHDGTCIYQGTDIGPILFETLTGATPYHMFWEKGDNWIELKFKQQGIDCRAYIAGYIKTGRIYKPQPQTQLLQFLHEQIKKAL